MQIGKSRVNTLQADTFVRVYTNTLTADATSITISGLAGNTDEIYMLRCKFVNGYAGGESTYYLRPNNDSSSSPYNYGRQVLLVYGGTTLAAVRADAVNYIFLGQIENENNVGYVETTLYAKSGYVRTGISRLLDKTAGTTVGGLFFEGFSWNNTADEITSLVISTNQTDGIGAGSIIDLYKLVRKS